MLRMRAERSILRLSRNVVNRKMKSARGDVVFRKLLTILFVFVLAATGAQVARGGCGEAEFRGVTQYRAGAGSGRLRMPRLGGQASNLARLVKALRGRGLKVERAGRVTQPFFSVGGNALAVNGDNVQVFRYATDKAAAREAVSISSDGSGGTTSTAMWVGPPHFHRKGRLIVLHVGSDTAVREALVALLGSQFAGR